MKLLRYPASLCFLALTFAVFAVHLGAQQNRADWIEWIPLCGKCMGPSISAKSGIGTDHAVAEGKVTLKDAQEWCASWEPENKACAKQQLDGEKGAVYRIAADCTHGRLTSFDDTSYTYAGVWTDEDIGKGRPKFRGADGKIVPRDHASGGLTLAAQWELLCLSSDRQTTGRTPKADAGAGKQH